MRHKRISAAGFVVLAAVLSVSAAAQEPRLEPIVPTASLPLAEVLRLYQENEESRREEETPPPFAATVVKTELEGRLLEGAIELVAAFEVVVLDDSQWVSVPLLKRQATMTLAALPQLDDGVVAYDGDNLSLVTETEGRYRFKVEMLVKARAGGGRRTAVFELATTAVARLSLRVDEGLFELVDTSAAAQGDTMVIYPENGTFTVVWQRVAEPRRPRQEVAKRPPIEPVVTTAHCAVVSTLEGKAIMRLLYELRFEGIRPIAFQLPEGQVPAHAYLNGRAQDVASGASEVQLEVEPRRAGDQSGTVELVLEIDQGGYNLAGDLLFALPRVSWPVNELYVDVHLPAVFNYTWTGGSLAPVEASPGAAFTYAIPTPGKRLSFRQFLLSRTSPNLRVDYAIDLDGKYFGGEPGT